MAKVDAYRRVVFVQVQLSCRDYLEKLGHQSICVVRGLKKSSLEFKPNKLKRLACRAGTNLGKILAKVRHVPYNVVQAKMFKNQFKGLYTQ